MNMSFTDIWLWFSQAQFPSLLAIWTWLITVPWWLAAATVIAVYVVVRVTYLLSWDLYMKATSTAFDFGRHLGEWLQIARSHLLKFWGLWKKHYQTSKRKPDKS